MGEAGASWVMIRDVDIESIEGDLAGIQDCRHMLVFLKFRGAVIGQAWVPVLDGKVSEQSLRDLVAGVTWPAWRQWLASSHRQHLPLPSATVVVCTRDRTDELVQGILSLARLAALGHEVVVIDNCPSDDSTARLVSEYPEIEYILEPRPGLDVARNRGLKEARGEIVAFIDDDAVPDDGWLAALLRNFEDPMVAVVTGITLPLELETPAQQWFEKTNSFGRGFERRSFEAQHMSVLGAGQVGAGVNMAVRRRALGEIGTFDEALDGGTPTLSGGDQEFFYRVLAHGYRIVYEPGAVVWHRHRREWEELRRTLFGYGVGLYAWWARALWIEGEWTALFWGLRWFIQQQVGNLLRALLHRPGHIPLDLAWAEFCGALAGPVRYLQSRRQLRGGSKPVDPYIAALEVEKASLSGTEPHVT